MIISRVALLFKISENLFQSKPCKTSLKRPYFEKNSHLEIYTIPR